jgi:hypothetical protein
MERNEGAAVVFVAREERREDADAEVETIEHDIGGDHDGDNPEPD